MRKLLTTLLFTMALAFSGMANALLISGTTTKVGGVDIFLGSTGSLANSNPGTETDWVNTILTDATFIVKNEDIAYQTVEGNLDVDFKEILTYAFALDSTSPDYFIVKNSNSWFLFENVAVFSWGVFEATSDMNLGDDFTISHVTEFVGPTSVPEPSISALLGLGLLGMIGVSRRKTVA